MTGFCKTRIPEGMQAVIDYIVSTTEDAKELAEKIKAYGIAYGIQLSKQLTEQGVPGLHYYTLNTSATTLAIVGGLGYEAKEV